MADPSPDAARRRTRTSGRKTARDEAQEPAHPDPGAPGSADGALAGVPFEEALSRLESVVARLEDGELELEDSLEAFEEGVRLTRHCAEQLGAAERRIETLVAEGDALVARPLELEEVRGAGASDDD